MITRVLCSLAVFVLWVSVENVSACQCFTLSSVYDSFESESAVFSGTVVKRSLTPDQGVYEFEVIESFKGVTSQRVIVNNRTNMCEWRFEIGATYLIYARSDKDGRLHTRNFCTRNSELDFAQGQVHYLRKFQRGRPEPQVYGFLARYDNIPGSTKPRATPLGGRKVVIANSQKRIELLTSPDGSFELSNLAPARYTLSLDKAEDYKNISYPDSQIFRVLPDGSVLYSTYRQIFPSDDNEPDKYSGDELNSNGLYHQFRLRWPNKFDGRVKDAEGKPIKDAQIMLLPTENPTLPETFSNPYPSNHYDEGGQTPGKYVLAGILNAPLGGKPHFSLFYPSAKVAKDATVFNIEGPESRTLDFVFPVRQRTITGTVLWSDTTKIPAPINVYLTGSDQPPIDDGSGTRYYVFDHVDGTGAFSMTGYVNAEYWVHVVAFPDNSIPESLKERPGVKVNVKPFKIRIGEENKPIQIFVPAPVGDLEHSKR